MTDDPPVYAEQGDPHRVSRRNDDVKVNVQEQVTQQGRTEYAASYQRLTTYDNGYEAEGIALSLFIKDPETTRLLYECLREFFDPRKRPPDDSTPIWERGLKVVCPECGTEYDDGPGKGVIHPSPCEECGANLENVLPEPKDGRV